ncbi:hypothetical protein [Halorhabdus sp. BNX81]|uniref:DUF7530 family protein n=1 Tax=Halorhabdus sp. BNX81 TaxID=2980181 RepID=UPI0023DCF70A|nr:hypothetical protein [Halorhabdus sp. BNX81]WEL21168.1 putative membrane protein [Halorhabdus sp. BNX81]
MTPRQPDGRDVSDPRSNQRWVYESIVGSIPGVSLSRGAALVLQLVIFEAGVVALAAGYGRWGSLPAGTVAVVVASAGSVFMLTIGRRTRRLDVPEQYTHTLFGTGIEIVLGLVAFFALVTYLFVLDPGSGGETVLTGLLGEPLPAPAVFFTLVVLWDVCYRIGTGWWASLIGLWRSLWLSEALDRETVDELRRIDAITIGFAWIQLSLVPFVVGHPILVAAVVGHVVAITLVSGASILVLHRLK